jgi:hypothetical protein
MLGDIDELDRRPSANRGMTPRIFEYLFARIKAVICHVLKILEFLSTIAFAGGENVWSLIYSLVGTGRGKP